MSSENEEKMCTWCAARKAWLSKPIFSLYEKVGEVWLCEPCDSQFLFAYRLDEESGGLGFVTKHGDWLLEFAILAAKHLERKPPPPAEVTVYGREGFVEAIMESSVLLSEDKEVEH